MPFYQDLNLPISCKNHWDECDFSGDLESVITHEEDCPYRTVRCVVLNCWEEIRFNLIENHMAEEHGNMSNGQWHIFPKVKPMSHYDHVGPFNFILIKLCSLFRIMAHM